MLLSFRFTNYRSFRAEQHLNLTPVYGGGQAVPVVGIFGANASGKSNTLKALAWLQNLVLRSDRDTEPEGGIAREPFRLDAESATVPSSFVVDLLIDGVRYTYGVELDADAVLAEWLYSYPSNRRRKIFERDDSAYSYGEAARRTTIAQVESVTAGNVLFLSTAARFDQAIVRPVYRWFRQELLGDRAMTRPHIDVSVVRRLIDSDHRRRTVSELLRAADTGVDEIVLLPGHDETLPTLEQALFDVAKVPLTPSRRAAYSNSFSRGFSGPGGDRLGFAHRGAHGPVYFSYADESAGTLQMLNIADRALRALESGGTVLIDEIDASLHPLLTAKVIGLFQSEQDNPKCAQLIFTSHDATLLGSLGGVEVLDRDEVWFVEKDRDTGASMLFPLSDFKPRKEENRQRRYLSGSYGAVPEASWDLFERALSQREAANGLEEGD